MWTRAPGEWFAQEPIYPNYVDVFSKERVMSDAWLNEKPDEVEVPENLTYEDAMFRKTFKYYVYGNNGYGRCFQIPTPVQVEKKRYDRAVRGYDRLLEGIRSEEDFYAEVYAFLTAVLLNTRFKFDEKNFVKHLGDIRLWYDMSGC